MDRLFRLLLVTFVESFATILVERGVYFYSQRSLGFGPTENLWLALGVGVTYVIGALVSHRMASRLGEKKLLALLMAGHLACHVSLAIWPSLWVFLPANLVLYFFTGAKWPLVESYVSAGRNARDTARAVGLFSIAWSTAVPVSMAAAGQLIAWRPWSLFAAAAAVNLVTIALLRPLEPRPLHLEDDHPERPSEDQLNAYRVLLLSSRWSMLASYVLLALVVPLMPDIFEKQLGFGVRAATVLAAVVQVVIAATFAWMYLAPGWHGKRGSLVWAAVGLPIGLLLMLFGSVVPRVFEGQELTLVLAGEVIFGVAAGIAYYAALYYAMVIANASVESGGAHESLVGGGFAIGPAIGLIGVGIAAAGVNETAGMLVPLAPVLILCLAFGLGPLRRLRRVTAG